LLWSRFDQDASLTSSFKIKGDSAREKVIYVTSMDFYAQVEKKVRQEVKAAGGFINFKETLAKNDQCKEGKCAKREIASVGAIIICILLLPICIFLLACENSTTGSCGDAFGLGV
jgi:hypothetical protein